MDVVTAGRILKQGEELRQSRLAGAVIHQSAAHRQLPQPLVDYHARAKAPLVLESKIVVDQHRHSLADQRTPVEVPAFPARCGEEDEMHGGKLDAPHGHLQHVNPVPGRRSPAMRDTLMLPA